MEIMRCILGWVEGKSYARELRLVVSGVKSVAYTDTTYRQYGDQRRTSPAVCMLNSPLNLLCCTAQASSYRPLYSTYNSYVNSGTANRVDIGSLTGRNVNSVAGMLAELS